MNKYYLVSRSYNGKYHHATHILEELETRVNMYHLIDVLYGSGSTSIIFPDMSSYYRASVLQEVVSNIIVEGDTLQDVLDRYKLLEL